MNAMVNFFQEDNGNYSMTRLMSLMSMLTAIGCAIATLIYSPAQGVMMTQLFLSTAFVPKLVQKPFEEKLDLKSSSK